MTYTQKCIKATLEVTLIRVQDPDSATVWRKLNWMCQSLEDDLDFVWSVNVGTVEQSEVETSEYYEELVAEDPEERARAIAEHEEELARYYADEAASGKAT